MTFRRFLLFFSMAAILSASACSTPPAPGKTTQPSLAAVTATHGLPTIQPKVTRAPDAESAARAFLQAWQSEDFAAMYAMLTPASQDALTQGKFTRRYMDAAIGMTMQTLDFAILSQMTNPSSAQVAYRVTFHTKMLGDQTTDSITMNLSIEQGTWRVQWDDGLIMPQLHGGNTLTMDITSPARGNIYDRNGNAVAASADIISFGMYKGKVNPDQENSIFNAFSRLTGKTQESIRASYENPNIYEGDWIPVGEVSKDQFSEQSKVLSNISGWDFKEYKARLYFNGGIAPHVTGYVQSISAEEKDQYLREGFRIDERVGKAGLEQWGEKYLLGQRSATLYVNDAQGATITRLAQIDAKPSDSITMTIDKNLQLAAQQAISGFSGAIVVLERDTGRVLALVSSPGYDPNAFEFENINSIKLADKINNDGQKRLYNRATGNGYPLGSVFKIITMAAALESGLFTPESTINCQYDWTEIPGVTLYDWTKAHDYKPSGVLTLPEGLMRSCNPWFYHIGYTLYTQGHDKDVSNMARAFGLGAKTGLVGINFDEPGNIPDPQNEQSAALIAIGQDKVLVNPLQVARFMAAVGNGGTLYRPQVVEKIADPDGNAVVQFAPDAQSTLPVSPENLKVIQDAMRAVVSDPRGTAVRAFSGLSIPVYGKTGTASTDLDTPHAWFAGYTNAGRADKPDIAFAVLAEYAGEGADIAAPIARRILEVYFMGQPQRVYPWESRMDVTRTPTPDGSETPVPANNGGSSNPPAQPQPGDNQPTEDLSGGDINMRTATPSP